MVMECTGFSSPRTDAFPAGLRVLVVDDDPTWLKILEKMLKKCFYEVTTCGLATEALELLREKRDGFDIVISDVNMPDMDGFKLLEHVGLEMDLPVIMMSVDGETSRVMKGVQHGACDYLLKPIRMKELKNIWQHVFRKRIHEGRDTDSHDGLEEIQMMINGSDYTDDTYLFSGTDLSSGKKRKDAENKYDDKEFSDTSSLKKARVVWTVDLHQKFVRAVDQIGLDKVGPKKILDLMGVPWLTRENVASHLQKYRLYLSRLQKDNEIKPSFGGLKHSVLSPRDPTGNVCLQNPLNPQLNDVPNDNSGISGSKNLMQNIDSKVHEGGIKGAVSVPVAEPKKAPSGDTTDSKKTSSPKISFNQSFQLPDSDMKYPAAIPLQCSWSAEYPQIQFKQESNARHYMENKFNHLPRPSLQHHVQINRNQPGPSFNFRPSDEVAEIEVKPAYVKNKSQGITQASQAETKSGTFPIQLECNLPSCHFLEPIPGPTWSRKSDFCLDQVLLSGSAFEALDGELLGYSVQGDFQPINISLENVESFDYNETELLAAVPPSLYESLKFDYEYPFDSMEYPVIDQTLFIV